jgi:hypothetical protein
MLRQGPLAGKMPRALITRLKVDHVERVSSAQVDRSRPTMTGSRARLAIDQLASAIRIHGGDCLEVIG